MGDLPKDVDCVVVGTGLVQTIVAAACARVGKSIIHVDKNPFYGEDWAALGLEDFVSVQQPPSEDDARPSQTTLGPHLLHVTTWDSGADIPRRRSIVVDVSPKLCFSRGKLVQLLVSSNSARYLEFKEVGSMFRHDGELSPVPCTKANLMTNRTISPMDKRRITKYLQFCLQYIRQPEHERELDVPEISFEDLLKSKFRLNDNLRAYIISSMTWLSGSATAREGVEKTALFLSSMDVYCPSPLLFPMYGSGEFSQAFSRLCAVFGGIYLLCQEAISIEVTHGDNEDDSHATMASVASVSTAMMGRVAAKKVVAPATFARQFVDPARDTVDDSAITRSTISRATLLFKVSESPHKGEKSSMDEEKIVDSVTKAETEGNFEGGEQATKPPAHKAQPFPVPYIDDHTKCCALVTVPPGQNGLPQQCRAIILSSASGVCPEGYGMCHLTTEGLDAASFKEELQRIARMLFPDMDFGEAFSGQNGAVDDTTTATAAAAAAQTLVWCVFFQQSGTTSTPPLIPTNVKGLHLCSGVGDSTVGFDVAVAEAEALFASMYPDEEFLPRAPDYDEIVFDFGDSDNDDDDDNNANNNTSNEVCATSYGTVYLPFSAYKRTPEGYTLKSVARANQAQAQAQAQGWQTTVFGTKYLPVAAYKRTAEGLVLAAKPLNEPTTPSSEGNATSAAIQEHNDSSDA